jgi:DNA-binding transcriptional ArsR family regulator
LATALADPTRRVVLERLGSGSATISELAQPFGMSLTGMKKHVRVLEEAQLVATVKVGRTRLCHLGPRRLDDIQLWVETYRQMVNEQLDRFGDVLDRTKETGSDRRPAEPPRRKLHEAERSRVPGGANL